MLELGIKKKDFFEHSIIQLYNDQPKMLKKSISFPPMFTEYFTPSIINESKNKEEKQFVSKI